MRKAIAAIGLLLVAAGSAWSSDSAGKILILHDEIAQMKVLAKRLRSEGYTVDFVTTKEKLPALDAYKAVIVFVHGFFPPKQAEAVIRYTRSGGRMIALHHTISSKKRKTPAWLEFLGVELPEGDVFRGGYTWQHGVRLCLVNLAPGHYITTHKIKYKGKVEYKRSDVDEIARERDYIEFPNSEAFINHQFTDGDAKTVLYGFRCSHPRLGDKVWMQDRAGWLKKAGRGWIFYFMPGHTLSDLRNPVYQQIILNCLTWKP